MLSSSRKINYLDVAKMIATLLVISGHILRMYTEEGLFVPLDGNSAFSVVCHYIYRFHMPLFFMLSGGVFYISKRMNNKYNCQISFIENKAKRLLVPYLFLSILLLMVMLYIGKVNGNIWCYYFDNYLLAQGCRHLWFLITLFIISILFNRFDKYLFSNKLFALLFFIHIYSDKFTYNFQIASVLRYFLYFYFGYHVQKHYKTIFSWSSNKFATFLILMLSVSSYISLSYIHIFVLQKIMEMFCAILGALFILALSEILVSNCCDFIQKNKVCELFYRNAYSIYLFHPLIIYVVFYELQNKYVNSYLLFCCTLLLAIILSIILSQLMRKCHLQKLLGEK